MKLVNFYRKPISMFLMVTFTILLCFWANQSSAAPVSGNNSATSLENDKSESTGFIEVEESEPAISKGKKFPWLIVGAAVVIGAAALYFLVLKSTKYTLTVSLSGATGTPAATDKYKKGTAVPYSYTPQSGYTNMEVKLDGAAVASSGTVTMDADHILTITAVQGSAISVNSTPSGANIYVNNADSGFTTPHTFSSSAAMTMSVLIRMCGYGDHTETVTANLGETKTINATLASGIHEDFNLPASSCWVPSNASYWSTSGGIYRYTRTLKNWDYNYYDYAFSGNYTLTAKMRRSQAGITYGNALFLASNNDMSSCSGYVFQYSANGYWCIWLAKGCSMTTGAGDWAWIHAWNKSDAIHKNLDTWNTLKVVKAGSNYTFYINDKKMISFTNADYDPKYAGLTFCSNNKNVIMEYDYVYLSAGATSDSIPGLPALPFAPTDKNSNRQQAEF
jgi:hypothetical protein